MQSINAQIFGLLVAAVLFVWLFKRIGLPPVLAYLAVGLLAGGHGVGWMAQSHEMDFIAELGIVFLLFSLGLEFCFAPRCSPRNFGIILKSACSGCRRQKSPLLGKLVDVSCRLQSAQP